MNNILTFLQQRNSAPRLIEPGPSEAEVLELVRAGIRAPDHAWLRPWRFVSIRGERREAFGAVLEHCLLARNPQADETARSKARNGPLRAPVVLVCVVSLQEHPKVPQIEQRLSAGCAAHAVLLASEALGYAGVWRTGDAAFDPRVMAALGLSSQEEIIGYLYLGTRDGGAKTLPALEAADFVSQW